MSPSVAQHGARLCAQLAIVHEQRPPPVGGGHEMFSATEMSGAERDFLVHEADAELLRLFRRAIISALRPPTKDLAAIRLQDAVDDVHQRRLAGAVLAGERMDLALAQAEADVLQRLDRAETPSRTPADFECEGFRS